MASVDDIEPIKTSQIIRAKCSGVTRISNNRTLRQGKIAQAYLAARFLLNV
jgi:hypothetical protein